MYDEADVFYTVTDMKKPAGSQKNRRKNVRDSYFMGEGKNPYDLDINKS